MVAFSKCSRITSEKAFHPWSSSSSYVALEVFSSIFRRSFKMYGSLYLFAAFLRRKNWEYFKKELLPEILQSTTFLSINGGLFVALICLFRKILGVLTYPTSCFIPAAIASYSAILVERPQRRGLLALYTFNNAIEAVFNALVQNNIIKKVPYGEVYIFCCATGLLMYLYRKNKLNNGFLRSIVRFLLNEKANGDSNGPSNNHLVIDYKNIYRRLLAPFKAFSLGYLVEVLPRILKSISMPRKIPTHLLDKSNFYLGFFLGSFVSTFQLIEFLMTVIRRKRDSLNSLMAGAASGLSLLFYRSSTISLYLLTKVLEIVLKNGQLEGYIPFLPHVDVIVYTISTATIFHMCFLHPLSVRPSYWKFICHVTNDKVIPGSKMLPKIFKT
ncbi:transmembrane protein 135-like [Xenia sp. Carnegie-2017]|uniref:transmembrane protein 135-like n=1 Tax=Xenia sp. Carnegie-2017 TaxID=2897299 RepID=UPI001F03653D|nr:transmembrane protein 135-like [Xenia sp. Carnegie-2017]